MERHSKMGLNTDNPDLKYKDLIIDLILESWRFSRVFNNMLAKLSDYKEYTRYQGRYLYFRKKSRLKYQYCCAKKAVNIIL